MRILLTLCIIVPILLFFTCQSPRVVDIQKPTLDLGNLTGAIYDSRDSSAMGNVVITYDRWGANEKSDTTDINGKYQLSIPIGTQVLTIWKRGHTPVVVKIPVKFVTYADFYIHFPR